MPTAIATPAGRANRASQAGRWNTLRVMRAMRLALLLLDLVLLLLAAQNAEGLYQTLRTLQGQAEPGLLAADQLRSDMSAMDAEAAHEFLQRYRNPGAAADQYDGRRTEVYRALLETAERTSEQGGERPFLETLATDLGSYERLLQEGRDLGGGSPASRALFERASGFMHGTLLPHADELEQRYRQDLANTLREESLHALTGQVLLLLVAGLAFAVLVLAQAFLSRKTRRNLNLPLLSASALLVFATCHLWGGLARARQELGAAENGAIASMHLLWRARATASETEAARSRWLLDPSREVDLRSSFLAKAEQVAVLPGDLTAEQLLGALRERRSVAGFSGLLAEELQHAPAQKDREPVLQALSNWLLYQASLSGPGSKPVAQNTPLHDGEILTGFDRAIASALEREQHDFVSSTDATLHELRAEELEVLLAAGVIAALLYLGFAPRIREYC